GPAKRRVGGLEADSGRLGQHRVVQTQPGRPQPRTGRAAVWGPVPVPASTVPVSTVPASAIQAGTAQASTAQEGTVEARPSRYPQTSSAAAIASWAATGSSASADTTAAGTIQPSPGWASMNLTSRWPCGRTGGNKVDR